MMKTDVRREPQDFSPIKFYGKVMYMDKYLDKSIYERAKKEVYDDYKKPSAYRSMALVKKYQALGGRLKPTKTKGTTQTWLKEKWKNLTPYSQGLAGKTDFVCGNKHPKQTKPSVCRPLKDVKKYTKSQIQKAVQIKSKGGVIDWNKL